MPGRVGLLLSSAPARLWPAARVAVVTAGPGRGVSGALVSQSRLREHTVGAVETSESWRSRPCRTGPTRGRPRAAREGVRPAGLRAKFLPLAVPPPCAPGRGGRLVASWPVARPSARPPHVVPAPVPLGSGAASRLVAAAGVGRAGRRRRVFTPRAVGPPRTPAEGKARSPETRPGVNESTRGLSRSHGGDP